MIEADAREFGERDREDARIDAATPKRKARKPMMAPQTIATADARREARSTAHAVMDVKRRGGIAAEPDIDGMAERQLPCEPHHDVPTPGRYRRSREW